jgi:hypothetical protein
MKKVFIAFLFITTCCIAQNQTFVPTELEQAQLAKLKAQNEALQQQLQQIDTQIQALTILKQLTTEHQQQKNSEFLGKANSIKEAHKDWGDSSKISYNSSQGESGMFSKSQETPKTIPVKK